MTKKEFASFFKEAAKYGREHSYPENRNAGYDMAMNWLVLQMGDALGFTTDEIAQNLIAMNHEIYE